MLYSTLLALQDLSHDIYYGVELVKNKRALQNLAWIMSSRMSEEHSDSAIQRHQAAAIIGNSVQNNPTALKEICTSWSSLMTDCNSDNPLNTRCEPSDLVPTIMKSLELEPHPDAAKSKVYALSNLVKDLSLRDTFLSQNGMSLLSRVFTRRSPDGNDTWEPVRKRIAYFVMDTFLDEGMGAQLGIWPQEPVIQDRYCELDEYAHRDGCWEYHLVKGGAADSGADGEGWMGEFLRLVKAARAGKKEEGGQEKDDVHALEKEL